MDQLDRPTVSRIIGTRQRNFLSNRTVMDHLPQKVLYLRYHNSVYRLQAGTFVESFPCFVRNCHPVAETKYCNTIVVGLYSSP